jgi:hypothetical protein
MRSGASRKAESTVEWSHDVTWEEVAEIGHVQPHTSTLVRTGHDAAARECR